MAALRISAKAEYATRAMIELAAQPEGKMLKVDELAGAQSLSAAFLVDILSDLRAARLVRSQRGREGGFGLARPASEITVADVLRAIDGPLVSIRDVSISELRYTGSTAALLDVWMAMRAGMRSVLETTSIADVAGADLPAHVAALAGEYRDQEAARQARRAPAGD